MENGQRKYEGTAKRVNMIIIGEFKEFEGNTVEEAIEKAGQELGVSKDRLEIKVVCEEKRGLFGMRGAKLAKIKAMLKT